MCAHFRDQCQASYVLNHFRGFYAVRNVVIVSDLDLNLSESTRLTIENVIVPRIRLSLLSIELRVGRDQLS